ncbi:MAG: flagellar biosynthesis [Firmicutes bacterium]|jgi:flagellar biosynthesis protein|nr:flagellar biosynthesis [Bacillota bacterium]
MMKKAVALGYDPELDIAPRVLAKGEGKLAEKIIAIAKEESIPLYSSPDLVASLLKIDLDANIPPELYQVVAQVLALVYRLDREYGARRSP